MFDVLQAKDKAAAGPVTGVRSALTSSDARLPEMPAASHESEVRLVRLCAVHAALINSMCV